MISTLSTTTRTLHAVCAGCKHTLYQIIIVKQTLLKGAQVCQQQPDLYCTGIVYVLLNNCWQVWVEMLNEYALEPLEPDPYLAQKILNSSFKARGLSDVIAGLIHMICWPDPHLFNVLFIPLQELQHNCHDIKTWLESGSDAAVSLCLQLLPQVCVWARLIFLWGEYRRGKFMRLWSWVWHRLGP